MSYVSHTWKTAINYVLHQNFTNKIGCRCTNKEYHIDVDNDFIEPSHESMEFNSAQPNIVADPSQITVPLPNKRPAQDVLAILAPQLPTKRIRAEKQQGGPRILKITWGR